MREWTASSWTRHGLACAALLLALLIALAPTAQADDDDDEPVIHSTPQVVGKATVGSTLSASGGRWSPSKAEPRYEWGRCTPSMSACYYIRDATSSRYTVTAADVGMRLAVRTTVKHKGETSDAKDSAPTAVVTRASAPAPAPVPTAPTPTATPQPTPSPTPEPTPAPTSSNGAFTDAGAPPPPPPPPPTSAPSSEAPASAPAARLLRPFPIVRIAGRFTSTRTRLTLVSVRAPIGARITMRCSKATCPRGAIRVRGKTTRLRALQRSFVRGAVVEIRITKPGVVGKHIRIRMASAAPPVRQDRCLSVRGSVIACPT